MPKGISVIKGLTEEQLDMQYPVGDLRNEQNASNDTDTEVVLDELSSHIKRQFEINRDDRTEMEYTMLAMLEAMANKYDADTMAQINKIGGSKLFIPLTSQQVSGGVAWLDSILSNGWSISPSPIAELSEQTKSQIRQDIQQVVSKAPIGDNGKPVGPEGNPLQPQDIEQIETIETDEAREKIQAIAKKRASRMSTLIEDQLVDSNWDATLKEFTNDLCVFPTAFIKTTYKKRSKMITSMESNKFTMTAKQELVAVDERVHPLDVFPSPDQTNINNGSLIERMKLSRKSIYDSIGLPGYSEENIRKVLQDYDKGGLSEWQTTVDNSRRVAEGHSWGFNSTADGSITGLRFMGPVMNQDLKQWVDRGTPEGFEWINNLDPDGDTEIDAILVGSHIIKVVPNLDPLGHRGWYASSYRKVPGSFWGTSIAMLAKPYQRMVNATARALSNNMGIASGPMAYILIDRLPQGEDLGAFQPWKIYQMTTDPSGSNIPPVNFFQPNDNSGNLLGVYDKYVSEAYSATGVPRPAMDGPTSRMASGDHTASGIASELESASKSIKLAASNIEKDIVIPRIRNQYYTNMIHHEDDSVKGDYQVVALGASTMIAKAVDNQQSIELLNALGGGPGAELIGLEGLGAILGRIAKNNDMPNLIPSEDEIKARQQQQMNQPPPPSDAQIKLEIERVRAETRLKDQQLEDKNAAAEREVRLAIAQLEFQGKQMELQGKQILADKSAEQQKEVTAIQGMNANARAKDANTTKLVTEQMKIANQNQRKE